MSLPCLGVYAPAPPLPPPPQAFDADFEYLSVPRNCRFLQGAHTDRQPVQRLKTAINEEKESVELLLNYKKNGDPFWNLLYVGELRLT